MIVSYVESILEDLESESDLDLEALVETLTAYLPPDKQKQLIPEEAITEWIFNLARELRNKQSKGRGGIISVYPGMGLDSFIRIAFSERKNGIDLKMVIEETTTSRSSPNGSGTTNGGGRTHKISEGSLSGGSLDYDSAKPGSISDACLIVLTLTSA